jgi:uncharacterized protein YrrD
MLYRLEQLLDLPIEASDGELGSISDVYFDDRHWTVRYLIVDAGIWMSRRQVLISPISVATIDWSERRVRVNLTKQQIEASPPIETDKPVSRQREAAFFDYYAYPHYWGGPSAWGTTSNPVSRATSAPHVFGALSEDFALALPGDPRLRSCKEVIGYRLQATDDPLGSLEDFLVDDVSWAMRYLLVNTRNGAPDRHIVIPPEWIEHVDWEEKTVKVKVSRRAVQNAPEYNPKLNFSDLKATMPHQP